MCVCVYVCVLFSGVSFFCLLWFCLFFVFVNSCVKPYILFVAELKRMDMSTSTSSANPGRCQNWSTFANQIYQVQSEINPIDYVTHILLHFTVTMFGVKTALSSDYST